MATISPHVPRSPDAAGTRRAVGHDTPDSALRMGIWLVIAASSMLFAGLTSAYVVSQGLGPGWKQLGMRPLVWMNTGVLVFSSLTMELARRRIGQPAAASRSVVFTLVLGLLFLAGQIAVFGQVARDGYHLNTGRQSSFYYLLSGLHGLHVVGGVFALAWLALRMRRAHDVGRTLRVEVVSVYWHFVGALWLYLLAVLFI